MSVNRLLLTFRSSDAQRLLMNLVSVGILMVMVGSAFADVEPHYRDDIDPGAAAQPTMPSVLYPDQRPLPNNPVADWLPADDGSSVVDGRAAAAAASVGVASVGAATHDARAPTLSSPTVGGSSVGELGFIHGFVASLSVILVSELGDKTFFIAAIMAMRHPRLVVFAGAIGALGLMTVLSAVFGMAATFIPRIYTFYISTALFAIFGLKMLRDGWYMSDAEAAEELEEVQSDLKKREDELLKTKASPTSVTVEPLHDAANGLDPLLVQSSSAGNLRSTRPGRRDRDEELNEGGVAKSGATSSGVGGSVIGGGAGIGSSMSEVNAIEMSTFGGSSKRDSKLVLRTNVAATSANGDVETGGMMRQQQLLRGSVRSLSSRASAAADKYVLSRVLMQAFTMTFLAEWGDRSQLTTIILSAREDVFGVVVGGVLGHSMCTGLAVIGGRMIAQRISVRTVTIVGGIVFLLFALSALFFGPGDEKPTIST